MDNKYADIINLEHHISKRHPQMTMYSRAAQFASFDALTGYEEAVEETARLTSDKIELSDEEKIILNNKIKEIQKNIYKHPKITVRYFIRDSKKDGGKYVTLSQKIKKIDEDTKMIILENDDRISILDIINIENDITN